MKIAVALAVALSLVGCSTVAGIGKDVTGVAEWTKEKIK
jgi:predicted small secreted protein